MRLHDITLHQVIYTTFIVMFLVVGWQALTDAPIPDSQPKEPPKPCAGEPIVVDYPYDGAFLEPWECQIQCEDKVQRHILYKNGKATQCEKLPGCLDWGEDHGETCVPQMVTPIGS